MCMPHIDLSEQVRILRERCRRLERERDDAYAMFAALVAASGGEVRIPHSYIATADSNKLNRFRSDIDNTCIIFTLHD